MACDADFIYLSPAFCDCDEGNSSTLLILLKSLSALCSNQAVTCTNSLQTKQQLGFKEVHAMLRLLCRPAVVAVRFSGRRRGVRFEREVTQPMTIDTV